jgi:hypothetical protein
MHVSRFVLFQAPSTATDQWPEVHTLWSMAAFLHWHQRCPSCKLLVHLSPCFISINVTFAKARVVTCWLQCTRYHDAFSLRCVCITKLMW